VAARDEGGRASRHDDEVSSLTAQISFLDEEIAVLRRRLADSPRLSNCTCGGRNRCRMRGAIHPVGCGNQTVTKEAPDHPLQALDAM
jgi:hypothetical protein